MFSSQPNHIQFSLVPLESLQAIMSNPMWKILLKWLDSKLSEKDIGQRFPKFIHTVALYIAVIFSHLQAKRNA